jgi:hypothetical protein
LTEGLEQIFLNVVRGGVIVLQNERWGDFSEEEVHRVWAASQPATSSLILHFIGTNGVRNPQFAPGQRFRNYIRTIVASNTDARVFFVATACYQ